MELNWVLGLKVIGGLRRWAKAQKALLASSPRERSWATVAKEQAIASEELLTVAESIRLEIRSQEEGPSHEARTA